MNSVVHEIIPHDAAEIVGLTQPRSFVEWLHRARPEIDGQAFDLDRVPWLRAIYHDESPYVVIRKGSQSGVTVWALMKMLYLADQGRRCIYFLPTDDEIDDLMQDRVDGTIQSSQYLQARMAGTNNVGLKKLGRGTIYGRGLWNTRKVKSVPADCLFFDEVDESKPENIAFGADRVLASKWQYRFYFSVPSMSDVGIDALFAATDQRFFRHKCGSCGRWNCLDEDFPANFLPVPIRQRKLFEEGATHYRGCRWCKERLDVADGSWVPTFRERTRRGYHISRLYSLAYPPHYPNAATYLMEEYEDAKRSQVAMERFQIAFRGYPFDGSGARITDELLDSLERDYGFEYSGTHCFMGVDQGDTLHISIFRIVERDKLQLIYCERTEDWDRLDALMERYGVAMGGCDGNPNRDSAKRFAGAFRKRAFIQDFTGQELKDRESLYRGHAAVRWVTIDRTESLDATVDLVESGRLILPNRRMLSGQDKLHYEEFLRHIKNLKSRIEETPRGPRKTYIKNAPNHQGMALNSARIAAFELGIKPPPTGTGPIFLSWFKRGGGA